MRFISGRQKIFEHLSTDTPKFSNCLPNISIENLLRFLFRIPKKAALYSALNPSFSILPIPKILELSPSKNLGFLASISSLIDLDHSENESPKDSSQLETKSS